MFRRVRNVFHGFSLKNRYKTVTTSPRYKRVVSRIQRRPIASFLAALGVLLLFLIVGSIINSLQKEEVKEEKQVKAVSIYKIGETPTVTLQAQVEKNGIATIVAQTAGIVDTVHVTEGTTVNQGQWLVSLSTNYQGQNAQAVQAQIAGAQYRNVKKTYGTQKEIIAKQREVAEKSRENTDEMRRIAEESANDTRGLLQLNEDLLDQANTALDLAEQTGSPSAIAAAQAQRAQLQAGVVQLRSSLRQLEYQGSNDKPPADLADLQRDITLKQLDLQEKSLALNKEITGLQYSLALITESLMHPASPFNGTVERVFVSEGQAVSPGTVIATVTSGNIVTSAIVRAPRDIALAISRTEPSIFLIGNKRISATPTYVSTVATEGQLHSVIYAFPEDALFNTTDKEYIKVQIPVGFVDTTATPFVPLDAVHISQNETTVFVNEKNTVVSKPVTIGQVYGSYVEVISGLSAGDSLIINRNIIAGDAIKISE